MTIVDAAMETARIYLRRKDAGEPVKLREIVEEVSRRSRTITSVALLYYLAGIGVRALMERVVVDNSEADSVEESAQQAADRMFNSGELSGS